MRSDHFILKAFSPSASRPITHYTVRRTKKIFVALIGGTVVLLGLAMLVLPGPGVLVMVAGVAILATEFVWARRAWRKAKGTAARARRKSGLRDWLRRAKAKWETARRRAGLGGRRPAG